ncbi:MAG TPA: hypothetical protein VJ715_12280 [Pyrinomonadaceae bacterium]|nr:hypothetical protein [Pyrinomonadaceae bacterium]
MNQKLVMLKRLFISLALLLSLTSLSALAQEAEKPATPKGASSNDEKAEQIVRQAVEVMGGSAYLNVRSAVGRGLFTQYKDGQSGIPSSFLDYIVFPDRERTEFKGQGGKIIQTNDRETGWIYDGASKALKDMTKEQVADFKRAMRASVDNLLRGYWRKENATLSYVGRREAGLAKRNEVVRLTYPDGFAVEFEFGAKDSLPMKILYKKTDADGAESDEEDRMAQHIAVQGVIAPFVIDHYTAGTQTSRINYQSIEFNSPLADTLFARPANAKAVK